MLAPQVQTTKSEIATIRGLAEERHRRGDDPFHVVAGMSAGLDALLARLFNEHLQSEAEDAALLAVGGYGRRELCPYSDIDILFVRRGAAAADAIGKFVLLLWDSGLQLGHAVRTPDECLAFMQDDLTTANTLLESRFLAGSQRMYAEFEARALNRYRRRRAEAFVRAKMDLLRQSVEDPQRTIYVLEPNVKEGMCGLREIQRVLWIENFKSQGDTFESLLTQGRFRQDEVQDLRAAYAFYLRLRCELHFTNGLRQDILERDMVLDVATNLGFAKDTDEQGAVEKLMGEYYRHARNVNRFLRFYLQTDTRGRSLFERLQRWIRSKSVNPYLSLYKGSLYVAANPPEGVTPETILQIFEIAQARGARLSEALCAWIRRRLLEMDVDIDFAKLPEILLSFRSILRGPNVGRILKSMHETRVLDRILPEFGRLSCLVNYDGHHQFTVDEHTLKTLEELDRVDLEPDYPEPQIQSTLREVKDHLPLRLALLLHDVGKAIPGEHSVSGTEAARRICERLGLDAKTIDVVDFLIYHHLELFSVSEHRDYSEDGVIATLARLVGTEERLSMLYVLTYLDIVSVGPGTWTNWKGAQLAEVYERTRIHLRTGGGRGADLEVQLQASNLSEEHKQQVAEHCRLMGRPGYVRESLPERMLFHLALVERYLEKREMQVANDSFVGYHEITFCGQDRPRLFADLAGVLYSEGFNVLGARIYSRTDGVVIDLFQVAIADSVQLTVEERVARLRRKVRKIESGEETVEDFIRQRSRMHRMKKFPKPLFGPKVGFDDDISDVASVIEVSAGDRPGLLYDLAKALHSMGLDVRTAKVSTLTDRAHDVFYVVEGSGGKVTSQERKNEIAQALLAQARHPVEVPAGT